MEIRNIETFLRVAELKSFTRAAENLGYAQSTVTFQIQQIEKELGVPLFERISKKVALTSAGERLVEYATAMIDVEHKIMKLSQNQDLPRGMLRIGVPESLLTSYLAPHIRMYCERFPDTDLRIQSNSSPTLITQLHQNDLDIALVLGEHVIDSNLVTDISRPDTLVFVTSSENPICRVKGLKFADVIREPLLVTDMESTYRKVLEKCCSERNHPLRPLLQSNNVSVLKYLLRRDMGIAYLPRYVVQTDLDNGTLCMLNVQDMENQPLVIHLVHHRNKWMTPQMEGFISLFRETFDVTKESKNPSGTRRTSL